MTGSLILVYMKEVLHTFRLQDFHSPFCWMPITLEEEKTNKQTKNPENDFIVYGFQFSTEPSVVLSQMHICETTHHKG